MPNDLVDAMLGQKGYKDAGTTKKVPALSKAKDNVKGLIDKTQKDLEATVSLLAKELKRFDQMLLSAQNTMEKILKAGGSLGDAIEGSAIEIKRAMKQMKIDVSGEKNEGPSWLDVINTFIKHPNKIVFPFTGPDIITQWYLDQNEKKEQEQKEEQKKMDDLTKPKTTSSSKPITKAERKLTIEFMMNPNFQKFVKVASNNGR